MRFFLFFILMLSNLAFYFYFYNLYRQKIELDAELIKLERQTEPIKKGNEKLMADLDYYQNPKSWELELKKNGYALPNEKMIVLIPKKQ